MTATVIIRGRRWEGPEESPGNGALENNMAGEGRGIYTSGKRSEVCEGMALDAGEGAVSDAAKESN